MIFARIRISALFSSLLVVAAASFSAVAVAETPSQEDRVDVYVGAGVGAWPSPQAGGHGWGIAAVAVEEMPGDARFVATFNTETLSLEYLDVNLARDLRLGVRLKGEFGYAGLLPDYYRRGLLEPARGFEASYAEAHAHLKWLFASSQSIEMHVDGRQWFFNRLDPTSDELTLPANHFMTIPSLRYVFWSVEQDPSISQMHRPFWRVRGLAFGASVELIHHTNASAWGARAESFDIRDRRNDPDRLASSFQQWLKAGKQVVPGARVQFAEWAAWSEGVDDLQRDAVGGMNPFVVPVAGLPWASLLSERYLLTQLSLHFRIWEDIEAGVLANAGGVSDLRRVGALNELGAVAGFGGFVDARIGQWQADLRVGWSPDFNWQESSPHIGLLLAVGKVF